MASAISETPPEYSPTQCHAQDRIQSAQLSGTLFLMHSNTDFDFAPILIADDSDNDVFMLKSRLKLAKLLNPVFSVFNGEEAISYLQGHGSYRNRAEYPYPVLLLLDLKMPRKDGFEVMEWMKSHPEHQHLPVIVLSALGGVHQISRCFQLGARHFLLKPVDVRKFRHSLGCMRDINVIENDAGCRLEAAQPPTGVPTHAFSESDFAIWDSSVSER